MSRSLARRHAFNLIYQIPFHVDINESVFANLRSFYYQLIEDDLSEYDLGDLKLLESKYMDYANDVSWGVFERLSSIDEAINMFSGTWSTTRMSRIDLAILRLAVYEMLRVKDVPTRVAINEAVELAKKYGDDESSSFINGILGGVSKKMTEYNFDAQT